MNSSSDNSFIPKRGTSKKRQPGSTGKFDILSSVSYILTFATLLAAGGTYLYAQYTSNQLDTAIAALNEEIGSFNQADMERVTQFNLRLSQAKGRLENSASVTSVFEALQAATIDTVRIDNLVMERVGDENFEMKAEIQTDSFDSTMFQRGVYLRNGIIQEVQISNIQNVLATNANGAKDDEAGSGQESAPRPTVAFTASLSIPLTEVPSNPLTPQTNAADVDTQLPAPEQTSEQAEELNEDTL